MYEAEANAHQAGLFGLKLEEIPPEIIEIWDINWDAFRVFYAMFTQWRVGPGGYTGLDYSAIPNVASMLGYKKKESRACA